MSTIKQWVTYTNIQLGVNIRSVCLDSHSGRQNWSLQLDQYKGTF